ncbi:DeoR/GlpR transcriptional regulator [Paenibacillaceae bacterium]|nr:DeoR/GlpR transcriptional regulator [Paenibacillaceae bacterium]
MNATLNDRQRQIVDLLQAEGEVRVTELRDSLSVTEMTIRRDLEKLEAAGIAKRTFGGAIVLGKDIALQERSGFMIDQKIRIGRHAAELILPGESVFIDSGTTTLQVARHIKPEYNITVVTNALNVAAELIGRGVTTLVTGGIMVEATSSMVGPIAAQSMTDMAFDRVFLGATGVSALHGFSNSNVNEAEIKRLAIKRAADVNIVLDHTKFGVKELFSFAPLAGINRLITDQSPADELRHACGEAGLEIVLA